MSPDPEALAEAAAWLELAMPFLVGIIVLMVLLDVFLLLAVILGTWAERPTHR